MSGYHRRLEYGLSVRLILTFACFALSSFAPVLQAQDDRPAERQDSSGISRIVAVADVHGAYEELVGALNAAGVIDDAERWSGGATHLVSLGDLLDRGGSSRRVMDLLMRLQREAAGHGGAVHVVLGNHELMNLLGDLRYVAAEEYAAFRDEEPAEARRAARERFLGEVQGELSEPEALEAFEERYPPGYFGHRLAFRPDGVYGAWLLSLPALVVLNDTAFVHGGLPELVSSMTAAEINERIRDHLQRYFAARDELSAAGLLPELDMELDLELAREALRSLAAGDDTADPSLAPLLEELIALSEAPELGPDGPLWYRGAVYCNPFVEMPLLRSALQRLDAVRVVVGHTVTDDRRVRALYDGRLIMLDTGMLREYYGGRPAALILERDDVLVQYMAPPERRPPEPSRVEAYGLNEAQIAEALARGIVEGPADGGLDGDAAVDVNVRYQDQTIEAIFYPERRGIAHAELAAHELDRLLGLHLLPPTVPRAVDGQEGALQLRYPDAMSEAARLERGLPLGTWCAIEPQLELMYAFDVVTFNTGRSADNVFYRHELSAVKLIGHDGAFGTERRPRVPDGLALSPSTRAALMALDEQQVEAALGDWLGRRQIRALLARRDWLLEEAEGD